MKHTSQSMREMAELVAYPSLSLDDIRNRAAAMLRDIADEMEATQMSDTNAEAELAFIEKWLYFRFEPIGMDCCGHGTEHGCCGNGIPAYHTDQDVVDGLNKRHQELLQKLSAAPLPKGNV